MKRSAHFRRIAVALLTSLLVVLPFAGYYASWAGIALHPKEQERVTIVAKDTQMGTQLKLEVRRGGVKLDPQRFLGKAVISEGWYVDAEGWMRTDELKRPLTFDVQIPNNDEFYFGSELLSPRVTIECEHGNRVEDLFNGCHHHIQYLKVSGNALHPSANGEISIKIVLIGCMVVTLLFVVLYGWLQIPLSLLVYGVTLLGMVATALLLRQFSAGYSLLLAASAGAAALVYACRKLRESLWAFTKGWPMVGMICLYLYSAFALYGNPLFLQMPVVTITLRTVTLFWMLTVITAPLLSLLVAAIALARHQTLLVQTSMQPRTSRELTVTRILCMLCMLVPFGLAALGMYPSLMTMDGTVYWSRGLGLEPMGQPFGYSILMKGLGFFSSNPVIYTVFQMLVFTAAASHILCTLYRRGASRWMVCLIAFATAIWPSGYTNAALLSTNPLMAIMMLYGIALVSELGEDPNRSVTKKSWLVGIVACGVAMGQIRRNSMPALLVLLAVLGYLAWKHRGQVAKRLAVVILCIAVLTGGLNGYGDRVLEEAGAVEHNAGTINRFLFKPIAAAYVNGCEMPEETLEVINRVYGEQWIKIAYDPHDSDAIVWYSEHNNLDAETLPTYLRIFMDTLVRYPAAVIKDLLDQSELAWSVFACPLNENVRYCRDIQLTAEMREKVDTWLKPVDHPLPQTGKLLNQLTHDFADAVGNVPLLDSLTYRAGAYIILFLALVLVMLQKRRGVVLLSMLPVLPFAATTFLAASFPIYQYFWFFPLNVSFFALLCIWDAKETACAVGTSTKA